MIADSEKTLHQFLIVTIRLSCTVSDIFKYFVSRKNYVMVFSPLGGAAGDLY